MAVLWLQKAVRSFLARRRASTAVLQLHEAAHVSCVRHPAETVRAQFSPAAQAPSSPAAVCLIHPFQDAVSLGDQACKAPQLPSLLLPSMTVRQHPEDGADAFRRRPGASGLHSSRGRWPAALGTARFATWLFQEVHAQLITRLFPWDPGGDRWVLGPWIHSRADRGHHLGFNFPSINDLRFRF